MMEEVCISVTLGVSEDLSEDEIVAQLVCEAAPKHQQGYSKVLQMEENLLIPENPLYTYQRENQKLQEASVRLEQENDNLALSLITSKISLRNALDKAEDQVEELTEKLSLMTQRLQEVEEEKQEKKRMDAELKQVFLREMEKAECEMQRMSGVITEYKQICSQLTAELDSQRCEAEQKLEDIKSVTTDCVRCSRALGCDPPPPAQTSDSDSLREQISQLERELAHSKLQMVQSTCKIQELEHQKRALINELNASKHTWIRRTLSSLRHAPSYKQAGQDTNHAPSNTQPIHSTGHAPCRHAQCQEAISETLLYSHMTGPAH